MKSFEEIEKNSETNYEKVEEMDYRCLICGELLPLKTIRKFKRGKEYASDYYYDVDIYDTSTDNYFIRIRNSDVLVSAYKNLLKEKYEKEINELNKKIEENVLLTEFKNIIRENKSNELSKKYKNLLEKFKGFIDWFEEPFEEYRYYQPKYTVHKECIEEDLSKCVNKRFIVDENENKEILLRGELVFSINDFLKKFRYISEVFGIEEINAQDKIILECDFMKK
jgi:excinuclease UvrABC ATPase subunit